MPCDKRELLEAFEEGIRVMELTAPVEVVGNEVEGLKCIKMRPANLDEKTAQIQQQD